MKQIEEKNDMQPINLQLRLIQQFITSHLGTQEDPKDLVTLWTGYIYPEHYVENIPHIELPYARERRTFRGLEDFASRNPIRRMYGEVGLLLHLFDHIRPRSLAESISLVVSSHRELRRMIRAAQK